jgi:hypothetical protein
MLKATEAESTAITAIQGLIEDVERLLYADEQALDALQRRTRMIIRRVFGDHCSYLRDFNDIVFLPKDWSNSDEFDEVWVSGEAQMSNLFKTMLEEVTSFGLPLMPLSAGGYDDIKVTNRVFVVHGHDEGMKQAAARTLEKLGLDPIILAEKPGQGRTAMEKLDRYSDVSFALVLLSPDDMGYRRDASSGIARPRARQNVVHELGYFTGKLGRTNVLVLFRKEEGFEIPSNHAGVLYVPYDEAGHWKFDLAKELKECGYVVDANRLL